MSKSLTLIVSVSSEDVTLTVSQFLDDLTGNKGQLSDTKDAINKIPNEQ